MVQGGGLGVGVQEDVRVRVYEAGEEGQVAEVEVGVGDGGVGWRGSGVDLGD